MAISLALAGLAAVWPMPASAASVTSVYEAGRCIVRADRNAAIALMRVLPLDADVADLSSLRGRAAACVDGIDDATALLVRGAVAQALFFRDFHRMLMDPHVMLRMANLDLPVESSPPGTRIVELYRWSDCVVRNDIPGTERLLRSEIGSEAETAAFEGLRNFMAACMPTGSQLSMQRWEVRSLLAQSAYHTNYRWITGQLQPNRPRPRLPG
jgi:hypothetical protein